MDVTVHRILTMIVMFLISLVLILIMHVKISKLANPFSVWIILASLYLYVAITTSIVFAAELDAVRGDTYPVMVILNHVLIFYGILAVAVAPYLRGQAITLWIAIISLGLGIGLMAFDVILRGSLFNGLMGTFLYAISIFSGYDTYRSAKTSQFMTFIFIASMTSLPLCWFNFGNIA